MNKIYSLVIDTFRKGIEGEKGILPDLTDEEKSEFLKLIKTFCIKDDNEIKKYILNISDKLDLLSNKKEYLYKYLDVLTPREREIINSRYGLDNSNSLTQKKISKRLGISRSYVSRIEKRALTKLYREFLKNNKI